MPKHAITHGAKLFDVRTGPSPLQMTVHQNVARAT